MSAYPNHPDRDDVPNPDDQPDPSTPPPPDNLVDRGKRLVDRWGWVVTVPYGLWKLWNDWFGPNGPWPGGPPTDLWV